MPKTTDSDIDDKLRVILDNYADKRQINRDNYEAGNKDTFSAVIYVTLTQIKEVTRKEWAAEVEALLPEKKEIYKGINNVEGMNASTLRRQKSINYGFNDAIDQVKNILERFK